MEDRWVFILNPVAGNGFATQYRPVIEEQLSRRGIKASMVLTNGKGHAAELAASFAKEGYRYIIGVGGDGTMNEIGSGLLGFEGVVTGLIPAGTGNDFIQILGFPDRFSDDDWDRFFALKSLPMDVGFCNGVPFLNGMGLGFDAEVAAKNYVSPDQVKRGGKGKYIKHILSTLFFYKEKRMVVKSDHGSHESDCFINTVSIGRRFAGAFYLTPKALANDGLLDVCNIKRLSLFSRLRILTMVPKGTHLNDKRIHYFQTSQLDISFPQKMPFHVDGELGYAQDFNIRIQPGALKIIYNPDGPHYFSL